MSYLLPELQGKNYCEQIFTQMKKITISITTATLIFISAGISRAQENLIASVDVLSSVALYNTYIAIGSIGDGYSAEYYTGEEAITFMEEQITLMQIVAEQIKNLADSGEITNVEDIAYLHEEESVFFRPSPSGILSEGLPGQWIS